MTGNQNGGRITTLVGNSEEEGKKKKKKEKVERICAGSGMTRPDPTPVTKIVEQPMANEQEGHSVSGRDHCVASGAYYLPTYHPSSWPGPELEILGIWTRSSFSLSALSYPEGGELEVVVAYKVFEKRLVRRHGILDGRRIHGWLPLLHEILDRGGEKQQPVTKHTRKVGKFEFLGTPQ
ncbi:uncharacterized protein BT62DRAFT_995735 [Guyanagaster necrorhizus]|uniref:Uncharacterized protein n=1 Tax=Guyanagaster necrorhizus TaxID=856835 RepID=A0A9P7VNU3_9AGAR|nr:uncharacterized protein BT62DRAFT_995735 [Guyanagaster necrorhizus MCA 3950]KAG7443980.1 hypothetical protein BT62DRAFT_995735 [Guyanagaster necrorhizus MCA 3950]